MDTSARLLRLLSLLQMRRDWPGAELAQRLEVSPRTVRRDIERLRDLGYPVHATQGTAGYRLAAGAALPPLLLDDDEAVAVAVALRTAAHVPLTGVEEVALRALTKLEQVLPSRLRRRVQALQKYTVPMRGTGGPTLSAELLTTITGACRDSERLRFDYRDRLGGESLRTVEPHRIVSWGRRWYLVAWDVDRADWRIFRVDRMRPRIPLGPRCAPRELPGGEAVEDYVARRIGWSVWAHQAEIRLHVPAEAVAPWVAKSSGELEPIDEHTCLLRTGADSVQALAHFIGVFEADFDIVSGPQELRRHLDVLGARFSRAAALPPA